MYRTPTFLLAIALVLGILLGNYFIISKTEKNIKAFAELPPFRWEDLTQSAPLVPLLDGNLKTTWTKKNKSPDKFDFFVELKLTHIWNGEVFSPRKFTQLVFFACPNQSLPKFRVRILERESINVDKELRMPKDKEVLSFAYKGGEKIWKLPLDKLPTYFPQKDFPKGISILTAELSFPNNSACLAEMVLEERKAD